MQDQVSDLVEKGRLLPAADRERVINGLLESLNEPASAALDLAWADEIAKRLAEYDSGSVQVIDADIVFAKARKQLAG